MDYKEITKNFSTIVSLKIGLVIGAVIILTVFIIKQNADQLILIINVDTLRYDSLGEYGNTRSLTPHLDGLIKSKGVLFNYAFATSNNTRPSVSSLFTGLYPTKHGAFCYRHAITKAKPNIATVLPDEYKTVYVNSNPNTAPFFKKYFDFAWSKYPKKDPNYSACGFYPAEYVFEQAHKLLTEAEFPKKVLVYIQPTDPHGPYYPQKEYPDLFSGDSQKEKYVGLLGTYLADFRWTDKYFEVTEDGILPTITTEELINLKNRYDAEVRYLDEQFYSFWQFICKKYRNILFVFTSDHGESFLDHNDAGHTSSMYNEQIRIPFIIFDTKKRFGKPRRSNILISNVDILPTIADIVGDKKNLELDGKSILKLIKEHKCLPRLREKRLIVSEHILSSVFWDIDSIKDMEIKKRLTPYVKKPLNVLMRATIEQSSYDNSIYKLIENKNKNQTETFLATFPRSYFFHKYYGGQLFRIDTDPGEEKNLIDCDLAVSERIINSSPLKEIFPDYGKKNEELDRQTIEQLKSLGYIR